jgi:hypothetical protein
MEQIAELGRTAAAAGDTRMNQVIMHETNARWEAGEIPDKELIGRIGQMLGRLAEAKALLAGGGLRPTSEGLRATFSGGARTTTAGPFAGRNEPGGGLTMPA